MFCFLELPGRSKTVGGRFRGETKRARGDTGRARVETGRSRGELGKSKVESLKLRANPGKPRADIAKTRADSVRSRPNAGRSRADTGRSKADMDAFRINPEGFQGDIDMSRSDADMSAAAPGKQDRDCHLTQATCAFNDVYLECTLTCFFLLHEEVIEKLHIYINNRLDCTRMGLTSGLVDFPHLPHPCLLGKCIQFTCKCVVILSLMASIDLLLSFRPWDSTSQSNLDVPPEQLFSFHLPFDSVLGFGESGIHRLLSLSSVEVVKIEVICIKNKVQLFRKVCAIP